MEIDGWGFSLPHIHAELINTYGLRLNQWCGAERAFTMEGCGFPTTVVVAEDNEDDRLLIKKVFDSKCQCFDLHFSKDGLELLDYLRNDGIAKSCIILLDLKMPRMDGIESLEKIKSDDKLKDIPVVLMTSSDAEDTMARNYCKDASSYIRKPISYIQLEHIINLIGRYWRKSLFLPDDAEFQN